MKIPKPLFNIILVKPIEYKTTETTLILSETMHDRKHFGVIMAKGSLVSEHIKVDDIVLWIDNKGEELILDGEEFIVMNDYDLKAVM